MQTMEHIKTPGQLIEFLLNERGWSQVLLSSILGKDASTVSKLVTGKLDISPELAVLLEEAFSLPAEKFLEVQQNFDLAKARFAVTPDPRRTKIGRAHV